MTAKDITLISNKLGIPLNQIIPLTQFKYMCLSKLETKVIIPESYRFKFDMENEVLVCYKCQRVFHSPEEGLGDTFQEKNYQYLLNNSGEPLVDVYDFSNILSIGLA